MAQQALCFRSSLSGQALAFRAPAQPSNCRGQKSTLVVTCKESRIGKLPIAVPKSVQVTVDGQRVQVKGKLGMLEETIPDLIEIKQEDEATLRVYRKNESRRANQLHGLSRSLINNMVEGVANGYTKVLQMIGVGYRAASAGDTLSLFIGYSHPVPIKVPQGIKAQVEKNTTITITGINKAAVGNFAATIRRFRPPEPYKGKGIRYEGEVIKMKEGKRGK